MDYDIGIKRLCLNRIIEYFHFVNFIIMEVEVTHNHKSSTSKVKKYYLEIMFAKDI